MKREALEDMAKTVFHARKMMEKISVRMPWIPFQQFENGVRLREEGVPNLTEMSVSPRGQLKDSQGKATEPLTSAGWSWNKG